MELPQSPLALALYLAAAVLTALGANPDRGRVPAFLGGLLWAAGTVGALVDGASLDVALCAALALLLLSTGFWKKGGGRA